VRNRSRLKLDTGGGGESYGTNPRLKKQQLVDRGELPNGEGKDRKGKAIRLKGGGEGRSSIPSQKGIRTKDGAKKERSGWSQQMTDWKREEERGTWIRKRGSLKIESPTEGGGRLAISLKICPADHR